MIGFKLKVDKFSQHFLEIMHDSSFNNDIQTIKLCFELFESREYSKLPNLLQAVLATSAQKCLKEREMLIVMCGIFTGLHQKNLEEALLYAKLNLQ